jgi:hypothetical protein
MIGDPFKYVAQIGFRVQIVEFDCSDESIDRSATLAAIVRSCKRPVLAFMETYA